MHSVVGLWRRREICTLENCWKWPGLPFFLLSMHPGEGLSNCGHLTEEQESVLIVLARSAGELDYRRKH